MLSGRSVTLSALGLAVALVMTGCSGGDDADPVEVLASAAAPGAAWKLDIDGLSDAIGTELVPEKGQVAVVDPELSEDGTESGTISNQYGVGWSRTVTDADLSAACDELADWVLKTAKTLPGDVDTSDQKKPSRSDLVAKCLATKDQKADAGESLSDGFLGYPNSNQGDHRYGLFADLRLKGDQRTLLAVYVVQRKY